VAQVLSYNLAVHQLPPYDPSLPIHQRREEIIHAIRTCRAVIVCGQTGSGKTTQLPRLALEAGRGVRGVIGHTQPRRLAARAVASRIAEELGVPLGGLVGVKVRFTERTSRATRIKLLTDGMLLAEAGSDPRLGDYDTLIIDEAHERSINIDLLLALARRCLEERDDFRLIVTSATIDPQRFSAYLGGESVAPIIEVSGRMYPVELRYRPPEGDPNARQREEPLEFDPRHVAEAVGDLVTSTPPEGDILVFLPGEREIRLAAVALQREPGVRGLSVLPLYARLSAAEQDRIFHPVRGERRVILATNVAETSLTVPGIRSVVDTGLARVARYDPVAKVRRLPVEPIPQSSAVQRAGRCGRVAAGVCVRLYSEPDFLARPATLEPEIRRADIAGVILRVLALGLGDLESLRMLDAPDASAIREGYETLHELGAVDRPGRGCQLTDVGRRMSLLPLDPRPARVLLASADERCVSEALVVTAAISVQDPRERPMGRQDEADLAHAAFRDERSDALTLLNLWSQFQAAENEREWCRRHFVSHARMREWVEIWQQLRDLAEEAGLVSDDRMMTRSCGDSASDLPSRLHRALLVGLIANVCCREEAHRHSTYRGFRTSGIALHPGSVLFKSPPRWVVAGEIVQTTRIYARMVVPIEPAWVEELASHVLTRQLSDPHWDRESGEPVCWERVTLAGVVVVPRRKSPLSRLDHASAREIMLREGLASIRPDTPGICESERAATWVARVQSVLQRVHALEARLRRGDLRVPERQLADWWNGRIPAHVVSVSTLKDWCERASEHELNAAVPELGDLLVDPALADHLQDGSFPEHLSVDVGSNAGSGQAAAWPLAYVCKPGADDDGVSVSIPLAELPLLTPARAAWLVPGLLPQVVLALVKGLPAKHRDRLGDGASLASLAEHAAKLMLFARGPLHQELSEAIEAVTGVRIPAEAFSDRSRPDHLRLRVVVVDDDGRTVAAGRDVSELQSRLRPRVERAVANRRRDRFAREGITTWDFGPLPSRPTETIDGTGSGYPALLDAGVSVSLTLEEDPVIAGEMTRLGIRRLFALACREECEHRIEATTSWSTLKRLFAPLGDARSLQDAIVCLAAERAFMTSQAPVCDAVSFSERLQGQWGRLGQCVRESMDLVARILEPRSRMAARFAGGTPRLWASSVADIREQMAYLMPPGFLLLTPPERLWELPRYVTSAHERLFRLREDGSGVEKQALAQIAPYWKRFTAWVAAAMSRERERVDRLSNPGVSSRSEGSARSRSPLPQARRSAPSVNLDAGAWALRPGRLPAVVSAYRWALEEYRIRLFTPDSMLAKGVPIGPRELDSLWLRVEQAAVETG
jgi:ATP-dependent helicase HrpA